MVTAPKEPVLKATPEHQALLLDVQAADTRLAQLAHGEATLPATAQLNELTELLAELNTDIVNAATELSDLEREVRRAEDEVEQVRARINKDQQLLDSGSITSGKQLEELQHEITSLLRRQGELEDNQLEVMERAEEAATKVAALKARVADVEGNRDQVSAEQSAVLAQIEVERTEVIAKRDALVVDVPADLLALYEKLRESLGGVGAAPLRGSRCEGCHMQLAPTDLKVIADSAPDDVVRCEECRRILIRAGVN